ncbi:TFIIB-type zinc ribbon-containing protein [Sulfitobacter sp.]|uniref:TFIIB-type zinc ribbon-containing protein n=1 Tax=Sulfitobacter sp. TaxID=1903071 RepID=UPI003FCC55D0
MLCPLCQTGLSMSDRNGVEIDFCPSCRGVWLDRGELDKIIERSSVHEARDNEARNSPDQRSDARGLVGMASSLLKGEDDRYRDRHRDDRYDDRRYDKRRKKKSIFSEFFD